MRLMRYGDAFATATSGVGWLYRVSDRVCFDLLRQQARRSETTFDVERARSGLDSGQSVADREIVLRFLSEFDAKTQSLAVLHYLDELPQERIAEELGWSRPTVSARLAHLQKRAAALRVRLGVAP